MNKKIQTLKYVILDFFMAFIAWGLFFIYRKKEFYYDFNEYIKAVFDDPKFYYGLIFIPILWLLLYTVFGSYRNIFRRSRIKEFSQILLATFIGSTIIFFLFILDDVVMSYKDYYKFYVFLFTVHFLLTASSRFILTTVTNKKIHTGKLSFNTLLIGNNGSALKVFNDITKAEVYSGNRFVGYINVNENSKNLISELLDCLGNIKDIPEVVKQYNIEELIIAVDPSEHSLIEKILVETNKLNLRIKIMPDYKDIISGSVKYNAIFNIPLIELPDEIMPYWQLLAKRVIDVVVSILAIIILLPVYIILAIGVKRSSKGPIFYSHERIGLRGKPFQIFKFRSMVINAESAGKPMLSSKTDSRITKFGKFLRKYRLDEIPQFYNVLIGEMSLVGPRPERQFFINQIVDRAPHYLLLHKVKPGITSLGQVKYGYAENVDEMIDRMKYDLLYIENMSLAMDIKVLFYTVLIVLKGSGK